MNNHKSPYYKSIDGLRFLAAVNVALFHYVTTMGGLDAMGGSPGWLFNGIKGPMFHASLFFILGGFIFGTKISPRIDSFSVSHFLKTRLRQLYPLHFVTTIMMLVIIQTGGSPIPLGEMVQSLFIHLSLLFPFVPGLANNLNTPSWALGAFFFAYLLLKPTLLVVRTIKSPAMIFVGIFFSWIILAQWSAFYALIGSGSHKFFFHMFPVVRFAEFLMGILLSQLFYIWAIKPGELGKPFWVKLLTDALIVGVVIGLFQLVKVQQRSGIGFEFFSYHTLQPLLFLALVALLAFQQGLIAKIMSFRFIRALGRGSFYPYLLHIPVAIFAQRIYYGITGDPKFFHYPWAIISLLVFLYGLGAITTKIMSRWRVSTVALLDEEK